MQSTACRPRVKICGITRLEDAQAAISLGADALGFVFYKKSPRYIDPMAAKEIVSMLPPFVTAVGLFVNESPSVVEACAKKAFLSLLQFHGDEEADYCDQFSLPYMKAVRFNGGDEFMKIVNAHPNSRGILVDSYVPGVPGGTGKQFDWHALTPIDKPLILAGGLTPSNINEAIRLVRPYGVDVSGGVESAKGIKDRAKIEAFMKEVACAN